MRYQNLLVLSAAGLLIGCATSPAPSVSPMVLKPLHPACAEPCQPLPEPPASGNEIEMVLWVHDLVDVAGACRALHESCRESK